MNQSGRSMVEMLGVLTIVGVLSIGGIAAYSQAMLKYKLNKHVQAISYLLINALENTKKFEKSTTSQATYYAQIMKTLGLLPDGIITSDNSIVLTETIFNNTLYIYSYPSLYAMQHIIKPDNLGKEICRNLMIIAKEHSSELAYIMLDKMTGSSLTGSFKMYGQNNCKNQQLCLTKLTLTEMEQFCSNCNEAQYCGFCFV